jgi:precorrin-2 dehydrogenase/sirohydrochlorin ferrochelatase
MAARALYPIFLDLSGSRVVVVGAGAVGLRKVRGLLRAGAAVKVVSPEFVAEFGGLAIERVEREYRAGDLAGARLAFCATNRREVNRQVGMDARALGIPANVADAPGECEFIVPARLEHDNLQIAVYSGGAGPRRAAEVRDRIARWLAGAGWGNEG